MFHCPGKLLWLSGAPGMGKSTSAQLLARDHGYVYYEADAFAMMLNPFVDLHDDNPSMATAKQRILKGPISILAAESIIDVSDMDRYIDDLDRYVAVYHIISS